MPAISSKRYTYENIAVVDLPLHAALAHFTLHCCFQEDGGFLRVCTAIVLVIKFSDFFTWNVVNRLSSHIYQQTTRLQNVLHKTIKSINRSRQRGLVISVSDSQFGGPGFEPRSDHYLDLFLGSPEFKSRTRL